MAHVTDIGPWFYHQKLYYLTDHPPLLDRERTQEIEYPYRTGRCLVLRVPFTKTAHVLGVWTGQRKEQQALLAAMGGRVTRDNGISLDDYGVL